MTSALLLAVLLTADGGHADAGTPLAKPGACSTKPSICFSPTGQCDLEVASLIDKATKSVDIAIYSVNRPSIVEAILRAKKKPGMVVRMVLDTSQMVEERELPQLVKFQDAGIPMKRDTHQGIMHLKLVIVDDTWLATGSLNFTNNASENNDENLFVWKCPANALVYKQKFETMWGKFKDANEQIQKNLNAADAGQDAGPPKVDGGQKDAGALLTKDAGK